MRPTWVFLGILAACSRVPETKTDTGTEPDTETTDTPDDPETGSDTGPVVVDCGVPATRGPHWADHQLNGLTITDQPYTNDAGLAAVRDEARQASSRTTLDTPLTVTGAVVTWIDFINSDQQISLSVADSSGGLFLYQVEVPEPGSLAHGDVVSFVATEVFDFNARAEVTALTDFQVVGKGTPIWVVDAVKDGPLTPAVHTDAVVEVYGRITSDQADSCGGNNLCYPFEYGDFDNAVLRTPKTLKENDCIQAVATFFPFDDVLQIDASGFTDSMIY